MLEKLSSAILSLTNLKQTAYVQNYWSIIGKGDRLIYDILATWSYIFRNSIKHTSHSLLMSVWNLLESVKCLIHRNYNLLVHCIDFTIILESIFWVPTLLKLSQFVCGTILP